MRWRSGRRSSNVEDRRGQRVAGAAKIGGGALVVLLVIALVTGVDPTALLEMAGGAGEGAGAPAARPPGEDEAADFASVVIASTEDVWATEFSRRGASYRPPTLVLFTDLVRSACGFNTAASGPFYCPADAKVYLDLGFFRDLERLGAPGDFARAYVIGHEVGHHVQNLAGTSDRVRQLQARDPRRANALSVALELQADCYAGLWAGRAERSADLLEPGDVDEGLRAAAAIGDDRLQRNAGRAVQPESFTHGTSAQRAGWLRTGLEDGSLEACDTFTDGALSGLR